MTIASPPVVQEEDIRHFTLKDLLPEGQVLALNTVKGSLCLMEIRNDLPRLLCQTSLSEREMDLLLAMISLYPKFTPHEYIHAAYTYGTVTEKRLEQSRKALADANHADAWDSEMRPVRNALSRGRIKVRPCGIDIVSILESGYMLKPYVEREERYE